VVLVINSSSPFFFFFFADVGSVYVWSTEDPADFPSPNPIYGLGLNVYFNKTSPMTRLNGVSNELVGQTIESITGCIDSCSYESVFLKTYSGLVYAHGTGIQGTTASTLSLGSIG
jgi:hypothetical protein